MTEPSERKRPVEQLLDLFVYAPLGLLLNLEEVVPNLVERGHQQVNMARMFGQFAVDTGTKEARKRLEQLAERGAPRPSSGAGSRRPAPAEAAVETAAVVAEPAAASTAAASTAAANPPAGADAVPSADDLAIPGYDSLSASQVVPRLDGLSADERDAVRRYEAAHRGRKTILSKLAQLS